MIFRSRINPSSTAIITDVIDSAINVDGTICKLPGAYGPIPSVASLKFLYGYASTDSVVLREDEMKPKDNGHRTIHSNGPKVTIEDMIRECVEICAQVADQHLATEIAHAIRRLKPVISWP